MLVGEGNAGLGFGDGLPDEIHGPLTMTPLVGRGLLQRLQGFVKRADGTLHIALIGIGGSHGGSEQADRGEFKTPTLRNVSMTGPYMHDGKLKTLKNAG